MVQLITAILAIALVASLAIASVYYGGDAFTSGTAQAAASTIVAQGQQISAADTLYQTDNGGSHAADVSTLVSGGYLQSAPKLPTNVGNDLALDSTSGLVYGSVASAAICEEINAQLGVSTTPTISDGDSSDTADADEISAAISEQYGCGEFTDSTNAVSYHFGYK